MWSRGLRAAATLAAAAFLCVLAAASFSGCASPPAASALVVLPFPGTPTASPQAQIAFPTLETGDIRSVTVRGSQSGRHTGSLNALPGGDGCAFAPDIAFVPGESVTVDVVLASAAAGTAVGKPGATAINFVFDVAASPESVASTTTTTTGSASPPAQPATWTFRSQPDLHPPVMTVSTPNLDQSSSLVLVDAQFAPQSGAMILDADGNLVWFRPMPAGTLAMDLQVQTYQGNPVLTWWQGTVVSSGHGLGEGVIMSSSYQPVAEVHAADGYQADLHEFKITSRDSALITAYDTVRGDLTSVGGKADANVLDSVVQEIDIQTGRLLWEWHALGHVPASASYVGPPADASLPYDYFHINSIQELPSGDLLISARNTWAVYCVDRATGAIKWQLGGKSSSFTMGPGTQFEWQHDARMQTDGTITLFDDAASPKEEDQSRAIRIQLDMAAMKATLVSSYAHTPSLLAGSQGSMQVLPNGNVFVGWGDKPSFTEFAPDGSVVFDAAFPAPIQSYRAYRSDWSGRPTEPPSVSISPGSGNQLTVYASWNGATDVASWRVLAGSSPNNTTQLIATARTQGFETAIPVTTSLGYLTIRAIDSAGRPIGTTTLSR
jgi:hypothetical protein